jgi:hypothetical protein
MDTQYKLKNNLYRLNEMPPLSAAFINKQNSELFNSVLI